MVSDPVVNDGNRDASGKDTAAEAVEANESDEDSDSATSYDPNDIHSHIGSVDSLITINAWKDGY